MTDAAPGLTIPVSDRDHAEGSADAPVTLVEYGDYECPYCGKAFPIVKAIQEQMGDRLRFVFRNFPIATSHPHARRAAEAAEAAGAQGKFWPMHDLLYRHQRTLDEASLLRYAQRLELDMVLFEQDLQNHTYAQRVRDDFMSGVRSGVAGTPAFFINGVLYQERWEQEPLLAALEAAASG
ncbi:MAG TPA: DsbA family protein [Thermomicrobiales bacterium]|nr:DsbA family protein [Thermomicrobiales bacterium]